MQTWNLSHYKTKWSTPEAVETEITRLRTLTTTFRDAWKGRTDEFTHPPTLATAIGEYQAWATECGNAGALGYYAWLEQQLDSTSTENKTRYVKVMDVATELGNMVQFFDLAIGNIPVEAQALLLEAPELAPFKHYLGKSFARAKHQLSEPEERILNLKSTTAYERWVQLLSDRLDQEVRTVLTEDGEGEKPFNDLFGLLQSTDEAVRDSAAEAITSVLQQYAPIAEAELNSVLYDKKINDELRGFARPDSARHLSDDVESEVVDAMIAAVEEYNSLAHDLYRLKADLMGKKQLKYHERNVPIGNVIANYPYEEAAPLVSRVLHGLDTEFGDIFDMFTEEGRIDVAPRVGKSGGAFCVYWNSAEPVYVLLNHTGKLNDVLTLAHEMGHAINDEMMRKEQPELYFSTSLATAEVASTFMEDFVLEKLLEEADDKLKFSLAMKRLDDDISTIHRQVACYKFEHALHAALRKDGHISSEAIGEIFSTHMSEYMGDAVEQPEWSKDWWVYWSHVRRYFYVYSYASGLIISKAMQAMVRADKSKIDLVKQFLSAGASKSPKDLFADMGIDITDTEFWKQGLESIRVHLEETRELGKKLGKL